ncbi:helix-turn-helix domain-containing protein [Streptomyces sp. 796.1]|uniref:helix-turn-helix domain-containing protein n=1 Tax=Streptomyces sp. 796.1 TaxID=3163029 RepID=UPI0039C907F3
MSSHSPADVLAGVQDLSGAVGDRLVHLPDTATSLVFRAAPGGDGDLLVVGPRTRARYAAGKELPVCLRATLRPEVARAVLGVPISELVDRVLPLVALWGERAVRLERRLARAGGDGALVRSHLEVALRACVDAQPSTALAHGALVRAATAALSARRPTPLPVLAGQLSVSERHLRQLLTVGAGLPPKSFARISRLRRALAHGRRGTGAGPGAAPLAGLAAGAGYYDQSHMSAEFRTLLGVPPGAFFADRLPAAAAC